MTDALEDLAVLVKKPRPGGITIPEALYGRARAQLEELVFRGRNALPYVEDRLVDQASSCLSMLGTPEIRGDSMASLRMRLVDTVRTATRGGAV